LTDLTGAAAIDHGWSLMSMTKMQQYSFKKHIKAVYMLTKMGRFALICTSKIQKILSASGGFSS